MAVAFVPALLLHVYQRDGVRQYESTPSPVPTIAPARNLRFEAESLAASAQRLLSLRQARLIALDTAQTKAINGQRITTAGRTADMALDRAKATFGQEHQFAEFVRQKDEEILSASSRYQGQVSSLASLSEHEAEALFRLVREHNDNLSGRDLLAIGLVESHLRLCRQNGRLEIQQVYKDYEDAYLR